MIYLIRHARPARTGLLLGRLDEPLAPEAIPPSALLVEAVYSSPLARARATAAALFPQHKVIVLDELVEIGGGEWDGLSWREIELRWPELAAERLRDWWSALPPGAEPREAIERRAEAARQRIQAGPLPAAVVAHAGINVFFAEAGAAFAQDYLEVKIL